MKVMMTDFAKNQIRKTARYILTRSSADKAKTNSCLKYARQNVYLKQTLFLAQ